MCGFTQDKRLLVSPGRRRLWDSVRNDKTQRRYSGHLKVMEAFGFLRRENHRRDPASSEVADTSRSGCINRF
jgi:hypothetical protein